MTRTTDFVKFNMKETDYHLLSQSTIDKLQKVSKKALYLYFELLKLKPIDKDLELIRYTKRKLVEGFKGKNSRVNSSMCSKAFKELKEQTLITYEDDKIVFLN